jgi:YidC/Oxa1 family membrane protein insertase
VVVQAVESVEKATGFIHPNDVAAVLTKSPDELGYFRDLGLDFGWGTTSTAQWMIEHIHFYTGVPWWAAISLTAVAIRIALLKTTAMSLDTSAKMNYLKPEMETFKTRLLEARSKGDKQEMMMVQYEQKDMLKKAGINIANFGWQFLQIPIGFGLWRFITNACWLPAPAFKDGGAFWFTDLTIADPTYMLPIIFGLTIHLTFRISGMAAGTTSQFTPLVKKGLLYGLPIFSTLLLSKAYAGLLIYFIAQGIASNISTYLFTIQGFRRFMGIAPLPPPRVVEAPENQSKLQLSENFKGGFANAAQTAEAAKQEESSANAGVLAKTLNMGAKVVPKEVKQAWNSTVESATKKQAERSAVVPGSRRTKKQMEEAVRYEQRRAKEEKEKEEARKARHAVPVHRI